MNSKIKYSLIIISTLLIGMVIGFLIGGRITSSRVENMRSYFTNQGFNSEFMRIIKPTPEQRDIIIPILEKHAVQNRELMINFHKGQKDLLVNLKTELDSHLGDEQIDRLNHVLENRNKRFRKAPTNNPRKDRRKKQFNE
jgi:hypothetical protein